MLWEGIYALSGLLLTFDSVDQPLLRLPSSKPILRKSAKHILESLVSTFPFVFGRFYGVLFLALRRNPFQTHCSHSPPESSPSMIARVGIQLPFQAINILTPTYHSSRAQIVSTTRWSVVRMLDIRKLRVACIQEFRVKGSEEDVSREKKIQNQSISSLEADYLWSQWEYYQAWYQHELYCVS